MINMISSVDSWLIGSATIVISKLFYIVVIGFIKVSGVYGATHTTTPDTLPYQ